MQLRFKTRLTSLMAAAVLLGSNWALRGFCEAYIVTSLIRPPKFPTPAEKICWQVSGSSLAAAFYPALLFLAIAIAFGEKGSPPVRAGIRIFVFLGVLGSLGLLVLTLVTLYFYSNLDPNVV
jgi:hypothetical protein